MKKSDEGQSYYSTKEVAVLFGKTVGQIIKAIKAGTLSSARKGKRGGHQIPSSEIFKAPKRNLKKI